KKEIFYRFMLPLVMHANTMVLDRRDRLQRLKTTIVNGKELSAEDDAWLREIAVILRIANREKVSKMKDSSELRKVIDQALYKLDVIPAGLVLGQAACESGYGTSRFAVKGNALFGQWTFGGEGLIPEQQRKQLGDHRIASFEWPFDSVRGYFINLSSHPAYEDFRRLRAKLKATGKPISSIELAEGLKNYSERGQAYVDSLKSIIRVNHLYIADNAVFRDEPIRFVLGAADQTAAKKLRADIEAMRKSGKLTQIIERMRLE
ncbi:MAG TPA: glucosaminidase domain-containing protein, partial [Desulfobacterales bacterium]|nr:glucosaminidase domain-containing protein [Desulfobacterales bacterium]